MAFYCDSNDIVYFSSFRSSPHIREDRIGGPFQVQKERLGILAYLLRFTMTVSVLATIILIFNLAQGWNDSDGNVIYVGLLAFVPFIMLVSSMIYSAGGGSMISLNNSELFLSMRNLSLIFHVASLFISFNISFVFISMYFGSVLEGFQDIFMMSLVNIFWALYFVRSVRNVWQLIYGSSSAG